MDIEIRAYERDDEEQVVDLWQSCNLVMPQNDPRRDIQLKLDQQPDMFLVGVIENRVAATVMVGYDGHRGWINYLAVAPAVRRQGVGRQMMREAELRLRELGCPKINLQVRSSNPAVIAFYERIGFSVDNVVSMGMRLPE